MVKKREGQKYVAFWVDEPEYAKWMQCIPSNLSEFIRDAVREKISCDDAEEQLILQKQESENLSIAIKQSIDEKFEELKELLKSSRGQDGETPDPRVRIAEIMKSVDRPVTLDEIHGWVGGSDKVLVAHLELLRESNALRFTKQGEYELVGAKHR